MKFNIDTKICALATMMLCISLCAKAQLSYNRLTRDTLNLWGEHLNLTSAGFEKHKTKLSDRKWFQITDVGVPLIAGGLLLKTEDSKFKALRDVYIPRFYTKYDNYLQYAPIVAMYGMKIGGLESRYTWPRMITSNVFSTGIMMAMVKSIKYAYKVERPDGKDKNSFPSGHTAIAFMGATMLHKEYGTTRSPWFSVAGYAIATTTGLSRIANDRHWLSDILVGAGIGVLSTEVGYYLADLIFKNKGIQRPLLDKSFDYVKNPSFIGLSIGFNVSPTKISLADNLKLKALSGSEISIDGAYFFNRHWGVGGKLLAAYQPMTVYEPSNNTDLESNPINILSLNVGPYFSVPIIDRVLLNFKVAPSLNYIFKNDIYQKTSSTQTSDAERKLLFKDKGHLKPGFNASTALKYVFSSNMAFKIFSEYNLIGDKSDYSTERQTAIVLYSGKSALLRSVTFGMGVDVMLWK